MLSKSERDAIRARAIDCEEYGDWVGDGMMGARCRTEMLALLDDLDAKDAELTRIAADKAYLFQANVANEWEDRYQCQVQRIEMKDAEIAELQKLLLDVQHYKSTACFHGDHQRCRQACKFCGMGCLCLCHGIDSIATKSEARS
jgi:hypothetical protein